jgi:hypothetical protein
MTLGNMRANGVRSLAMCCWQCHHEAVLDDGLPYWSRLHSVVRGLIEQDTAAYSTLLGVFTILISCFR